MQSKTNFLLLFVFFSAYFSTFRQFSSTFNQQKDIFFKNIPRKQTVFKTKDKRDVFKQNTTLTLYSITK
mgnify:CR=1 FL=1